MTVRMSQPREAPDPAPFVGRQAELAQLRAGINRASKQHGSLFFLTGEPGIGKTRLTEQVSAEAREIGSAVYWGFATQAEGAPPYWPWLQILRSLVQDRGPDDIGRLAGASLAQILLIAPELRGHFPDAPQATDDEGSRFRAYDSFVQLLVQASQRQPMLIILEDLHWADTASVILLGQLAGGIPHSGLMVVGTYRARELSTDHPLKTQLADFMRRGETTEIPLGGLGDADAAALLRAATDFEPDADLVKRLQRQTAGNPFFLKEVARVLSDDQLHRAGPVDSSGAVPEGVAAVLRRRISALSPGCRGALAFAAVAGQEINLDLVGSASGIARPELLDLLDEATARGVLTRRGRSYSFAHGLFRDTLHTELSTARSAELHRLIGISLQRRRQATADRAGPLAHHFVEAAVADDTLRGAALEYSLEAAEQASSELAYEAAVGHLETALGLADDVDAVRRVELLLKLGRARYLAGDIGRAVVVAQEASRLAEEMADGDLLARAALVVRGVGGPGLTRIIKGLCDAALRRAPVDRSLRIELLSQMVVVRMQTTEPEAAAEALEYSEEAITLARDATDPDVVFAAIHSRQMAKSGPDGVEERLALADRLLKLADETGRLGFAHWGHSWRADALVQLGRIDEAEIEVVEEGRAADVMGEPLARWRTLLAQSWLALMRGRFDEARRLSQGARRLGSLGHHPIAEFNFFMHEKALADLMGDAEDHHVAIDAFVREYPEMGPPFAVYDAIEHANKGRIAEAQAALRPMVGIDPKDIRPLMVWLPAMAMSARAAHAISHLDVAAKVYEALTPYKDQVVTTSAGMASIQGSVSRHLGLLAETLERWDDAASHYEAAIALEQRMGTPPYVACSEITYAELLLRRGGADGLRRARRLAEDGLAISRELGMAPWLERAKAVLRSLESKEVADHPLSKRELEVAVLVADGMSNRGIAERLHLSERTAESHVKNICDKLGLNSRSQVAAWAAARNFRTRIQ